MKVRRHNKPPSNILPDIIGASDEHPDYTPAARSIGMLTFPCDAVLFDMDGTLLDTKEYIYMYGFLFAVFTYNKGADRCK